ncbi:MAG: sulfite exporter TauE/SafE family protein [Oscillospiraceae bacterium]|nr:sulfite exporter TauE/SafE family protein [Oscillospiraceae bacterium]
MDNKYKAAVIGAAAGIVNGTFGAGGGMLLVPLLIGWLKLDEKKALATSVAIILPLSALSALVHLRTGAPGDISVWPFLIGGLFGGVIAGLTFGKIKSAWLRRAFALFVLYGGVRALLV